MSPIESLPVGIDGLALALESAAALLGALGIGIAVGVFFRGRVGRRPPAPPIAPEPARELESLRRIAAELSRTSDVEGVARALLDEIASLFRVGFVALAFVSDDASEASGFLARAGGKDVGWWRDLSLDLAREPSGIASAVYEASSFAVYDVSGSTRVSSRLAAETGAKSAAFVPLISDGQVIAVISVATTDDYRAFSADDLSVMQTLASEATIALERTRSTIALGEALERERLLATIGRRLRTELDVDDALALTVAETGQALGASRCFVRLGDGLPLAAQWTAPGATPVGDDPDQLPVSNLAALTQRTVAITDVQNAPELTEPSLGDVRNLRVLGARAVASTPMVAQNRPIGVLSAHRDSPRAWSRGELTLLEAVAAEAGAGIRLSRLLAENREQLAQQTALLRAAQVLSGELDLAAVLQRLVDEVAELLQADASDCYLFDRERGTLRCAAVHGLEPGLVGFEFGATQGLAGLAIREGRPLVGSGYGDLTDPVPHATYEGFTEAIVAPMRWSDDVQGVLGVGRRSGHPFTQRDADVLEAFAGLASLALRNAETFARSSRQARVQRGFYRVASVLGQSLSLAATLEAVAQAAAEALGGAGAAVLMPQPEALALAGSYGLPQSFAAALAEGVEEGDGLLARSAVQGRVLAAPRLDADERLPEAWREAAERDGYHSLLAVPVASPRNEGAGLVVVLFTEERVFSEDDLELARHLANATRGALERSELFEAERSARALAQQLTRTGRLLTTELDPAAVLDEVVQQAPELVRADACAIRVLEDEELVVSAAAGAGADDAVGSRSPASAWLSGDVLQSRSPVALEDASSDARLRALDPMLAGNAAYLGVPLLGPEGAPLGVLAVYAKQSRRWREEEVEAMLALAASTSAALANAELYQRVALEKERSFAILANIADGIVAVDREGLVVLWNQAAEKITGVAGSDALGRPPAELLQGSLESGSDTPIGDRLVSINRNREEVWLSLTEAVMRDPAGQVAGRIFAFRDISADRLVEQMKSDFVSSVSHGLRTPLTSIYGFAETLLRQDVLFGEAERQTFLGYIASESQRLTAIVDALLNVARLDTGDLQVNLAPTDVRDVVGEVVQSAQDGGGPNSHSFVLELPAEPLPANADRDKLRQVFQILLDNAIKYSPEGGTVTVGVERKRDTVEVSVADQGVGIPQADQEQIFRKFYRGSDAEARLGPGGPGLGLFIARGLVTAMGGRIWVESREGEGSTFAFELPAAASDRAPVGI
jgi:two-component system, NtrC family, sensor histidine kinase KinB